MGITRNLTGLLPGDIAGYVDRRVLDMPQVVISAGRPDAGLALAPAGMGRVMAARVADVCEDE